MFVDLQNGGGIYTWFTKVANTRLDKCIVIESHLVGNIARRVRNAHGHIYIYILIYINVSSKMSLPHSLHIDGAVL